VVPSHRTENFCVRPAEGDEGDKERRELRVIDKFEMERFFCFAGFGRRRPAGVRSQGDHRGRRTEFASDRGKMIAGNGADGAADVDDFGGSEIGRERGDDAA